MKDNNSNIIRTWEFEDTFFKLVFIYFLIIFNNFEIKINQSHEFTLIFTLESLVKIMVKRKLSVIRWFGLFSEKIWLTWVRISFLMENFCTNVWISKPSSVKNRQIMLRIMFDLNVGNYKLLSDTENWTQEASQSLSRKDGSNSLPLKV